MLERMRGVLRRSFRRLEPAQRRRLQPGCPRPRRDQRGGGLQTRRRTVPRLLRRLLQREPAHQERQRSENQRRRPGETQRAETLGDSEKEFRPDEISRPSVLPSQAALQVESETRGGGLVVT